MNPFLAKQVARFIDKGSFLAQLKAAWSQVIIKGADVEEETKNAMSNINSSPFREAFKVAKITEEDVRKVVEEICREKQQ